MVKLKLSRIIKFAASVAKESNSLNPTTPALLIRSDDKREDIEGFKSCKKTLSLSLSQQKNCRNDAQSENSYVEHPYV